MRSTPSGLRRLFFRSPVLLYRIGMGSLLGRRFMLLEHTGRRSGLPRRTVLEVPLIDEPDTFYAASGWGKTTDWYRNLEADPTATVTVGRRKFATTAQLLTPEESGALMARYRDERPRTAAAVAKAIGWHPTKIADWQELGHDHVPWIKLVAANSRQETSHEFGRQSGRGG